MGLSDKVNQFATSVGEGTKKASTSLLATTIKVLTAFVVSLTVTMVLQELFNYGTLSFVFILLVTVSLMMRLIWTWSIGAVLIFDLICVLVGALLRMYILLAP